MNTWDVIVVGGVPAGSSAARKIAETLKKDDSYLLSDYPYRVRPYPCCDPVHLRILWGIALGFALQSFYHHSEPFAW